MGSPVSKAQHGEAQETAKLNELVVILQNRLAYMESEMKKARGEAADKKDTEVCGGRSVKTLSQLCVSNGEGPADQIKKAIDLFMDSAQSAIHDKDEKQSKAKHSAVAAAQTLITGGLDALFGVGTGQGMEKKAFVVLFLNNTFVRVDYYVYTYNASAEQWGAQSNESGCAYVADLAVLDMGHLRPSEIDYLVSQALKIGKEDYEHLMAIKAGLVQVSILSRMLKMQDIRLTDIPEVVKDIAASQEKINEAFNQMAAEEKEEEKKKEEEEKKKKEEEDKKKEEEEAKKKEEEEEKKKKEEEEKKKKEEEEEKKKEEDEKNKNA